MSGSPVAAKANGENDPRRDPNWKYDGRLHCDVHRNTALARWKGAGPLVCPLCPDGDAIGKGDVVQL